MRFDIQNFRALDWAITGGAAVAFIAGFLPWWGYSGQLSLYGASVSGWSAGFTASAGTLLLVAAGVYLGLHRAGAQFPAMAIGPTMLVAAASGLGVLLILLRWLTFPNVGGGLGGQIGARYGIWVALLAGIVQLAAAVAEFRSSGDELPWSKTDVSESNAE